MNKEETSSHEFATVAVGVTVSGVAMRSMQELHKLQKHFRTLTGAQPRRIQVFPKC